MDDLGIKNVYGDKEVIQSNLEQFCLSCGCSINKENDSGWERFRPDGITTQKVCKKCDAEMGTPGKKAE